MGDPVFVIHGIGTRDQARFDAVLAGLTVATGGRWPLVGVYWGDLGVDVSHLGYTVPAWPPPGLAATGEQVGEQPGVADLFARPPEAPPVDGAELRGAARSRVPAEVAAGVAVAFTRATLAADTVEVRAGEGWEEEVLRVLDERWPMTRWLRLVDEPEMLGAIGTAVAGALADAGVDLVEPDAAEMRDRDAAAGFVRRRIADIDLLVGTVMNAAAGRVNAYLRTELGPVVHRFLGDTLVYQRDRSRIHDRVRAVVAEHGAGLGQDPRRPVQIIGHSFGGVIAVDLAVDENPMWIHSLVTIGAQASLFHVTDPRSPRLSAFRADDGPVRLPPSLRRWTNLWEPMDVLAFVAARVFALADGSAPSDVPVAHRASHGLWTHSAYWDTTELLDVMNRVFD